MSDTPETDMAIKAQSEWKLPFVSYTMGGLTYDGPVATFCRKLERERDEASEKLADALQEVDLRTLDFERMRAERDEARFLLKAAQSALDAIHLEVGGWIKTMKENTD